MFKLKAVTMTLVRRNSDLVCPNLPHINAFLIRLTSARYLTLATPECQSRTTSDLDTMTTLYLTTHPHGPFHRDSSSRDDTCHLHLGLLEDTDR